MQLALSAGVFQPGDPCAFLGRRSENLDRDYITSGPNIWSPFLLVLFILIIAAVATGASAETETPPQTMQANPTLPPLAQVAATPVPGATCRTYTVVPGDTMTRIAQRFNMSLETLLAANPQMSNPRLINPGETINIDCGVGGIILPNTGGDLAAQPGNGPLYTIRSGDTLPGIAARYQTTLGALLQANPELNPGGDLHPGQTIHLPNG